MSNKRWALWLPLLASAAWLAFGADEPTEVARAVQPTSKAVERSAMPPASRQATASTKSAPQMETLLPRKSLIRKRQAGSRRDLFMATSWMPTVTAPAVSDALPVEPPAAPFVYVGKLHDGSTWQVFVVRGEETLVLTQHSTIDDVYRVEALEPPVMKLLNLHSKEIQLLDIGAPQ